MHTQTLITKNRNTELRKQGIIEVRYAFEIQIRNFKKLRFSQSFVKVDLYRMESSCRRQVQDKAKPIIGWEGRVGGEKSRKEGEEGQGKEDGDRGGG